MYAPIILFVYSRLDHTKKTVESLKCNYLAKESDLIIYSDAGKDKISQVRVDAIRKYLLNIDGFKSVKLINREENCGLAKNIMNGVTEVINKYGKVIVLEDDIVTSPYFLSFMNESLNKYKDSKEVWHISGWNYPIDSEGLEDTFFWNTMNCWGWATWDDRWSHFEKNPNKLIESWSGEKIARFNLNNVCDFWSQVKDNQNGKLNTWAVFWYVTIFDNKGICLNPTISLVDNIGNDGSGENCGENDIYKAVLNNKCPKLLDKIIINELAVERIVNFYLSLKKPIYIRIINRVKRFFL